MEKRPIIVLCYARSGGTILNKCLSSFSSTVVMSEVNPHGGGSGKKDTTLLNNIKSQANEWYGIKLISSSFYDLVSELNNVCIDRNETLIIRDWSIVDFEPLKENNNNPSNIFSILNEVGHLNPIVVGFVRNSIDVWISRGQPEVNSFFYAYNNYVSSLKSLEVPIYKYEEFTSSPEMVLREICNHAHLAYEDVLDTASSYSKVNGDIQKGMNSRGERITKIRPMNRQIIPYSQIKLLNANLLMKKCNHDLGYGTDYFDEVSYPVYMAKRLGQFYYRQKKLYSLKW